LFKYKAGDYELIWSRSFVNIGGSYGPMLHAFPGDADNDGYNEIVVNYYDGGVDSVYVFDWVIVSRRCFRRKVRVGYLS